MFWARIFWAVVVFLGLTAAVYGAGYAGLADAGSAVTPQQLLIGKAFAWGGVVMICFGTIMSFFYERVAARSRS
ncbi:MAG: hypothetical protein J5J00_00780 [Deltaproteobacteria bacterium]|nr:hypothetical protein [Deltaproteobacteria bacterium]